MGYGDRDYYRPTGFGGFSYFPPIIKKLLIINFGVFFFQVIFSNLNFGGVPGWYILNRYLALNPLFGLDKVGEHYNFQIWQLLSYQFMHSTSDIWHILFNMLILWMFGMEIANMWGTRKFLIFYLACGIGAGILQIFLAPILSGGMAPTIGASGAVFGVMVAFAMFNPDRYIFLYFLIPVKAKYLIVFLIVFEFLSVGDMSFVAHLAHLGGAATGFLFVMYDKKYNFNFNRLFEKFKKPSSYSGKSFNFRKPMSDMFTRGKNVEEAEFYEINNKEKSSIEVDQEEIDRILDKISQSGYQNLTAKEKRVLFEASKKS